MKKITLFFILCIGFIFNSHAQLPETFDTEIPATWAVFSGLNGEGPTYTWVHNANGYILCQWEAAALGTTAEDWLVSPLTPITTATSLLTFDQTDYFAPDYGSSYTVRISTTSQTDITSFTTVDTQAEPSVTNGTALQFSGYSVDLSAYEGMSVYIAFVLEQNDGDAWFLDNIDLENQNATAPNPAITPTPLDTAIDVVIDATNTNAVAFAWAAAATGDPATSYDVYLGDSPTTLNLLGNLGATSVNITGMTYNTLYYWQIVAKNAGGDAVNSDIWSFTTEMDPSLSVAEFENSTFSVFPNPVKDQLHIKTEKTIDSIEVYNQLGQRVLMFNSILNNSVNVSSLNSGVYLISISSENKKQTLKIIKK